MSQYPPDEFDRVPESSARQGAHREHMQPPRSSGLGLKILVGVLALSVGFAAYFISPRLGIGQDSDSVSQSPSTASASPSATADTLDDATATTTPTPQAADAVTGGAEPASVVDRLQPVDVLNATSVSGLASAVAGRAAADGWALGQVGNWPGEPPQASAVFYNGAEQLANARAIGNLLGISTLQESAGVSSNVTVVLGPGFQ